MVVSRVCCSMATFSKAADRGAVDIYCYFFNAGRSFRAAAQSTAIYF
jgi:hypothetical protein